jgi:hypothetical protein
MNAELNRERQQAHALLDMLPDEKLNAVRTLREVMVEPLALAPVEEEEVTPETAAALERPPIPCPGRGCSARRAPA